MLVHQSCARLSDHCQIPMLDLSGDRKDLPMPKELPTWNSDALVDTLKTMVRCLR